MTPKFQHDCDACVFLGVSSVISRHCDLYYCRSSSGGSVIGRYSDDPPDYISCDLMGLPPRNQRNNVLHIAANLAKVKGLLQ